MTHRIRCTVCGEVAKARGQCGIDSFRESHRHEDRLSAATHATGTHLQLDSEIEYEEYQVACLHCGPLARRGSRAEAEAFARSIDSGHRSPICHVRIYKGSAVGTTTR